MDVTNQLARYVVEAAYDGLPSAVVQEAKRSLLNYLGVAVGGCRHEAVEIALAAVSQFSGPAHAAILGRRERLDPLHAALINGISSHVFDYDDTHRKTVIHPSGPVASAVLARGSGVPPSLCRQQCQTTDSLPPPQGARSVKNPGARGYPNAEAPLLRGAEEAE